MPPLYRNSFHPIPSYLILKGTLPDKVSLLAYHISSYLYLVQTLLLYIVFEMQSRRFKCSEKLAYPLCFHYIHYSPYEEKNIQSISLNYALFARRNLCATSFESITSVLEYPMISFVMAVTYPNSLGRLLPIKFIIQSDPPSFLPSIFSERDN